MTQYTITSWFIIKSWAPPWGHLAQTSWVARHENPTPLLYRVSGPFHGSFTVIYRGSEGDLCEAPTWTSRIWMMPSGPFGWPGIRENPTSKFQVPSTQVLLIIMSSQVTSYSWVCVVSLFGTHECEYPSFYLLILEYVNRVLIMTGVDIAIPMVPNFVEVKSNLTWTHVGSRAGSRF